MLLTQVWPEFAYAETRKMGSVRAFDGQSRAIVGWVLWMDLVKDCRRMVNGGKHDAYVIKV